VDQSQLFLCRHGPVSGLPQAGELCDYLPPLPPSLPQLFGSVRDDWLAEDPEGWIKANSFYAGTDLSLGCPKLESYVITTKQTRFVEALLGAQGREREGGKEGGWALGCPKLESYVITTKQTRFVEALLERKVGREGGRLTVSSHAWCKIKLTNSFSLPPSPRCGHSPRADLRARLRT